MDRWCRHVGAGTLLLLLLGAVAGCPSVPDSGVALRISPGTLDFGSAKDTLSLDITKNTSSQPMPPVTVLSQDPWVVVEACQSTSDNCVSEGPGDAVRVPVRVDRNQMELGGNTGSILVEGAGLAASVVEVTATSLAVADFTADDRAPEVGQEVQFTNQSASLPEAGSVIGVSWDFGDGSPAAVERSPLHVYEQAGIYTVTLTVTTEKQVATRVRHGYMSVNAYPPDASFSVSPSVVFVNDVVRFKDLSSAGAGGISEWVWDFGDGQTSTEQNPTHGYESPGMYAVSLTATNAFGDDTHTNPNAVLVQARVAPVAKFRVVTTELRVNSPVEFRDLSVPGTSAITRYAWDFGDGGTSNVANPAHTYRQPDTYSVTLTVETAHGVDTSDAVWISPEVAPPEADFAVDTQRPLTVDSVQFTDTSEPGTSAISSRQWDFGDGSVSSDAQPTHRYADPGRYTVTLTVTTSIGSDTETKTNYIQVFAPMPLDTYVRTPDSAYDYDEKATLSGSGYTAHVVRMTSQTWRSSSEVNGTLLWQHWLTVIEPDTLSSSTAMLFISGGNTSSGMPSLTDGELQALATLAVESESVVAQLKQVPNEPLTFADESLPRSEDAIIAYSFAQYLETGDETWPALFPMVKSAVRAMDTVQSVSSGIEKFVVSGASKRGWTTWLTAATDARVTGIVPMVFDALNMDEQMAHQLEVYGYYSEAVYDYVTMNIFDRFDTPEGQALLGMVDPYAYRERLTMPKLLINSTGDEFFLPDSAQFYFRELPGENYLAYLPNTSHSVSDLDAVVATCLPWYRALLEGVDIPGISWTVVEGEGRIIVETERTPLEVNLWTSTSSNRDFRLLSALNPETPGWSMTSLVSSGRNRYVGQVPWPDGGWTAFFVQTKYTSPFLYAWYPAPYIFTSEVRVIPETSPPPPPQERPSADFTALPLDPSLGGEVTFTDTSTSGTRPLIAWLWDFGDGEVSDVQNPTHPYSTLDAFDVSLTVYTALGSDTMTKPAYIVVRGAAVKPAAAFSATPRIGYAPLAVQFTDESTDGSESITSWVWDFGDGSTSTLQDPAHTYAESGVYTVSLTVASAAGEDTHTASAYIVVNAAAAADFTVDTTSPATFEVVHFEDLSNGFGSPIRTWQWDFGDGITSTDQSPVHAYTALGNYTVTLTVTTDHGGDTLSKPDFIIVSETAPSHLDEYVAAYDPNYSYTLQSQPQSVATAYGTFTVHLLNMTSQKWRTEEEVDYPIWRHWVTIIQPAVLANDTALLFITGGSNTSGPPTSPDEMLCALAGLTGNVVVELRGVPSEPLRFTDETRSRSEDEIIAYTFDKYMDSVAAGSPDPEWPLLLPMAKSAVRAMDTVQDYLASRGLAGAADRFVVSGGSKRGWTTWLTAIADPERRVAGIIPMVIDVLNIDIQMEHHRAVYGYWSPSIYDYAQMRVFERLGTAEGDALLNIVDPYRRRDKLAIPKLLVNSTGDQFFVSDSARYYFDDLPAPKYLNYIPNTDHGLNTEVSTITSIAAFFQSVAQGILRPQFTWSFDGVNTINVQAVSQPAQVNLWQAHIEPSATGGRRDFRLETIGAAWQRTLLTATAGAPGQYAGRVTVPATGWTAFLVQLVYSEGYIFTTEVRVVPDAYPEFTSYRTSVGTGADAVPVCVLYGEPYEMGYDLGTLMKTEIQELMPSFLELVQGSEPDYFSDASLDAAWAATSPYIDQRFKDELEGLASGAGVPLATLRRVHMIPLLDTYSCSSVAAWGAATANGHLLQTRDLDWTLDVGAQDYPCLAMYIPDSGTPHVNVGFAGYIGCQAGMNLGGIALAEMGDSPGRDMPYDLTGNHFTVMFREMLYDAMSLTEALDILSGSERIKKYHYVIGDGRNELAAVKIRAHEPEPLQVWTDNDPTDPNAVANGGDGVAVGVVYNDEGRGAWPFIYDNYGQLDVEAMIDIASSIPIEGSNVIDVVYDATDARLWVAFAEGYTEAYERPFVEFDMQDYLP